MDIIEFDLLYFYLLSSLVLGSFINNVSIRASGNDLYLINLASSCHYCKKCIPIFCNIPLISFFLLKGRSFCCNKAISWQYPFVEFLIFLGHIYLYKKYGVCIRSVELLVLLLVLTIVSIVDLRILCVSMRFLLLLNISGIVFGFFFNRGIFYFLFDNIYYCAFGYEFILRFFGLFFSFCFLLSLSKTLTYFLRKKNKIKKTDNSMGFADPILFSGVISFLGFWKIPVLLFLTSLNGLVFNFFIWGFKRNIFYSNIPKRTIPFSPCLLLAVLEGMVFLSF